MRIHTNTDHHVSIVTDALVTARTRGGVSQFVGLDSISFHGSRTHVRAIEVKLVSWSGGPGTDHPRRPNSGKYGADSREVWAATYDEWGHFLAALFDLDPTAKAGPYTGRDDFHRQTSGQYWTAPATAGGPAALGRW